MNKIDKIINKVVEKQKINQHFEELEINKATGKTLHLIT